MNYGYPVEQLILGRGFRPTAVWQPRRKGVSSNYLTPRAEVLMLVPNTQYAKSGDVRIAYQVVGDGPFDLVFVPGFISKLDLAWEDPSRAQVWTRLAAFSRFILFDKRCTGLSDRIGGIPTLEERMDDVRAVMDAVGSREAALFGTSEGGATARSIRCSLAISAAVEDLGLQVRAGLYTGEVEMTDNDLSGIAVHIASRIAATARPGQVLMSSTVRDLVAGSNIRFRDEGSHRLKGLEERVRLFAADHR